ncbi:MAG: ribosome-associated translation inhibitor RaiA [Candidatus Taylorbacteria bacterium]|nr:ribosome-associated translation inhibitor RaiA [Candidatus Taylorbacteria bacterium]
MNIRIKTTNVVLSPALSEYVNKCLDRVGNIVGEKTNVQYDVELARTTNHHQKGDVFMAEVHIVGGVIDAYASVERSDLNQAINDVRDEIIRELRSGKSKRMSYVRRGGARMKAMIKGIWPWGESGWYKRNK